MRRIVTRRLWRWLRPLVGVAILAVLGWRLGTGVFVAGLRVVTLWPVVAALGIGLFTTACSAGRWCLVARRLGLPLNLKTALGDYYRSLLLNAVLPAGVLGDVHRAVRHGQRSGDVGRGVRAVFLERFAGQVVLAVVGAGVLLARPSPFHVALPAHGAVIASVAVLAAVLAFAGWHRWGPAAGRRVVLAAMADGRLGLLSRGTWAPVAVLSAATVVGHVALFVVAARATGIAAPLGQLVPLVVPALVVMGLPVNIGGWGPREGFAAFAFGAAGLGATQGVTAAVVYGVLSLLASLPGVLVLILRRQGAPVSRTARYPAKDSTSPASTAAPLLAEARDGRPITPDPV
jgi:uncharacterized membrane protein YbhN (UPF0104 family)